MDKISQEKRYTKQDIIKLIKAHDKDLLDPSMTQYESNPVHRQLLESV